MANQKGYAGSIQHSGGQVVKAPCSGESKKGKGTVKKGEDLRSGKK